MLVNVAGIDQFRKFEDLDLAVWQRHLAVNLTGPMLMSHAALPHLRASKGNIVTIASIAGPARAAVPGGVLRLEGRRGAC